MTVLVDTHTLFWLITEDQRLSQHARVSCRQSDGLIIPAIVILELFYLLKKLRKKKNFYKIFERLKADAKYTIVSIDLTVLDASVEQANTLEMHDATIVATAKILNLPIITKDLQIKKVYKNTIW